jgi:hypothetical protein
MTRNCLLLCVRSIGVVFAVSVLFLLCGAKANAQSPSASGALGNSPMPIYIEEFFLSDAVRNEDKGELQFTFSADARETLGTNTVLQIEYGLTKRVQVSFEMPYGFTASEYSEVSAAWSTASVGVQYQIIRSAQPFALSVGMSFGVPVNRHSQLEFEPTILAAKTFRRLQVHASFLAEVEGWNPSLQYNLASVYPVREKWFPTLEFNGRRLEEKNAFYLTPGLYRHFPHRLEIGIGVPIGLSGVAAGIGVVGKLTWEFGGDHDDP